MKPSALLRIAAVISLAFAAGHTFGGAAMSWSPVGETEVLQAMRSFRFETSGVTRTYLDFYMGFGLIISVFLVAQAALLWHLAGVARRNAPQARPLVAILAAAVVANTVVTWKYISPLPLVFSLAIALCLALAVAALRASPAS